MKSYLQIGTLGALVATLGFATFAQPANAASMNVQWFTVQPDSDFGPIICCNVYTNEVQSTLGPNGYPILNKDYGGPTISDVNSGTGELTWWNPALNNSVTFTGTSTLTLPINQNMYPLNGTGGDDSNGFQAAILTGDLVVPTTEQVSFNLGSDDDSFLALGNTIIDQVGGVHGDSAAPVLTSVLDPGVYALTLFYVDRQQTGASLQFSINTQDVTLTAPTPLPAALPLFAAGFGLMGLLAKRRKKRTAAIRVA
jgi:hypothetical protein